VLLEDNNVVVVVIIGSSGGCWLRATRTRPLYAVVIKLGFRLALRAHCNNVSRRGRGSFVRRRSWSGYRWLGAYNLVALLGIGLIDRIKLLPIVYVFNGERLSIEWKRTIADTAIRTYG